MKKVSIIIFLIIASCSPVTQSTTQHTEISTLTSPTLIATRQKLPHLQTETPSSTLTPEKTKAYKSESFSTETIQPPITKTVQPTEAINGPTDYQIQKICPPNQVVSLLELEIPTEFRLLLLPWEALELKNRVRLYNPWVYSPKGNSVYELEGENYQGLWFPEDGYSDNVSPDKRWFFFYKPEADGANKTVWISSIDGQDLWPVLQIDLKNEVYWVSNQSLIVVGHPDAGDIPKLEFTDYFPFLMINPFSNEQKQLIYLADKESGRVALYFFSSQENLIIVYREHVEDRFYYYIHNYEGNETFSAFQWLKEIDIVDLKLSTSPVRLYDGGMFATIVDHYDVKSLDVAIGLSLKTAIENHTYDEVMIKITLPDPLKPPRVLGIVPENNNLALQRFNVFATGDRNWFYLIDIESQTITNYCLDLVDSVKNIKFSPDGQFAAITLERYPPSLDKSQLYVAIVDLTSGFVAYAKGFAVIDWGVVQVQELD